MIDVEEIIACGIEKINYYLTPETIIEYELNNKQIKELILATGEVYKYLFEGQNIEDSQLKLNVSNVIKATGRIEEYLKPNRIINFNLNGRDLANLVKAIKDKEKIQKYLFKNQKADDESLYLTMANIIKATGMIEEYLTPTKIKEFKLRGFEIVTLISAIEDKAKKKEYILTFLKPEQIKEFDIRGWDIAELIRMIENEEERQQYLFKGQSLEDESLYLSIANAIKVNNNINSFLVYEKIKEFDLSGSDIVNLIEVIEDDKNRQDCALSFLNYKKMQEYGIKDNALITKLIKLTGNIEIFLFVGQNANDANLLLNMSNVIKGQNCCPELDREEIELLCSFKDKYIILSVINLDVTKQKEAIFILDRLSKSNSAELRRIKIPMALQILEKNPSEYRSTLNRIEDIYLTNNIPIAGRLFLVFKELHPDFLGVEKARKNDKNYANIPSLRISSPNYRNNIIFSDLLRCAIESNSRNLRNYLNIIEEGNILYEKVFRNEVEMKDLSRKEIEILTKYRDILNSLYNVTAKAKRKGIRREGSDDLFKDLKELHLLFDKNLIKLNLPDRIIRTFGYYARIKSFKQLKSMIEEARLNAHERNIEIAKSGKVQLKEGDFVKGIQDTKYFPNMLQRGILAKEYLGRKCFD